MGSQVVLESVPARPWKENNKKKNAFIDLPSSYAVVMKLVVEDTSRLSHLGSGVSMSKLCQTCALWICESGTMLEGTLAVL